MHTLFHARAYSAILDLSLSEAKEFMEECNIAKKFDHPNVLSLLGISFTSEENKPLMVMPYMHYGDVKSYLKSKRGGLIDIKEFPKVGMVKCIIAITYQHSLIQCKLLAM